MSRNKWIIIGIFVCLAVAAHFRFSKSNEFQIDKAAAKRDPVKDKELYLNEIAMRKAARERERVQMEQAQARAAVQPAPANTGTPADSPALQNLARELVVAHDPKTAATAEKKKRNDNGEDDSRRYYVTRFGDTLFTVAEKELGDRRRWSQIAQLNDKAMKPGAALPASTRLKLPNADEPFTAAPPAPASVLPNPQNYTDDNP